MDVLPLFPCPTCDTRAAQIATRDKRLKRLTTLAKYWEKRCKASEAERDRIVQITLEDADHPLCTKYAEKVQELADLRATLRDVIDNRLFRAQPPAHGPSDQDLKHLVALAHPDKWSAGQPATALAHEVTVLLNALRAPKP